MIQLHWSWLSFYFPHFLFGHWASSEHGGALGIFLRKETAAMPPFSKAVPAAQRSVPRVWYKPAQSRANEITKAVSWVLVNHFYRPRAKAHRASNEQSRDFEGHLDPCFR